MAIIDIQSLCKSFGGNQILHDINLSIESGKLVGFLGPNGAGKTTTIRILLGLLRCSSGKVSIFERDCWNQGKFIRHQTGYLPGDVRMYSNIRARSYLKFLQRARKTKCADEVDRLANAFELNLNKTIRTFSSGMRQKLGLIQALMHQPDLLILDEPTSALDPLVRKSVFSELRSVTQQGRTVLFSSHSLNEVEELCDEVVILRDGRIVEHQSIDKLKDKALRRVTISFAESQTPPATGLEGLKIISREDLTISGTWSGDVQKLLDWLQPFQLDDLIVERPDLSDLFVTYYE